MRLFINFIRFYSDVSIKTHLYYIDCVYVFFSEEFNCLGITLLAGSLNKQTFNDVTVRANNELMTRELTRKSARFFFS